MVVNLATMETKLNPVTINKAVEIYATHPNVRHKEVANELGISDKTLMKLRKDADFWERVYKTYLVEYESEIPDVLRALIREAKAGSVMACRLVLEHGNKLQEHLNITITSPFERWLAMNDGKQIEEAEVVLDQLPPRTADNTPKKAHNDFIELEKVWNKRRRELHRWNKRAKAVNIDPMPARRPTPGQREEWQESIVKAEGL